MRRLLHADFAGLRNALTRKENRRSVLFAVVVWLLFTGGVFLGTGRLLLATPVRHAMRDAPGEVGPALLALLVVLPLVFAAAGSYVSAGSRLFGASTTELLLAAPLRRASIVAHALLRAYLSALGLALTIGLPAVMLFGARYGLHPLVLPAYVGLVAALLFPIVATMLAFQVVAKRLSLRPRWRAALNLLVFAAGIGIALLIAAGFMVGKAEIAALVERMQQPAVLPGWFVDAASLLGASAGLSPFELRPMRLLLLPIVALPFLAIASWLYPGAWEHSLVAPRGARRTRTRTRTWPAGVTASLARKDLWLTLRAGGSFAGLGVMAVIAVMFEATSLFKVPATSPVPAELLHAFQLTSIFAVLTLTLASLSGAGMLADEASAFDVIAASPAPRRSILLGKLPLALLPYALLALVLAAAAPFVRGVSAAGIGWFLAATVPVSASVLAPVIAVGTLPLLQRGGDATAATSFARLMATTVSAIVPGVAWVVTLVKTRSTLSARLHRDPSADATATAALWLGGAWFVAGLVAVVCLSVATRNMRVLFGPRDR